MQHQMQLVNNNQPAHQVGRESEITVFSSPFFHRQAVCSVCRVLVVHFCWYIKQVHWHWQSQQLMLVGAGCYRGSQICKAKFP